MYFCDVSLFPIIWSFLYLYLLKWVFSIWMSIFFPWIPINYLTWLIYKGKFELISDKFLKYNLFGAYQPLNRLVLSLNPIEVLSSESVESLNLRWGSWSRNASLDRAISDIRTTYQGEHVCLTLSKVWILDLQEVIFRGIWYHLI